MTPAAQSWRLTVHDELPSTSDLCRSLAQAGEPEGLAILARRQVQGRASHGRSWSSPPGNMYLSILLRPNTPIRQGGLWSLLAAVALADAVAPLLPDPSTLTLKWPNDLLLNGRKMAGILVDSHATQTGILDWLVIGLGLNLATAPQLPDRPSACLADATTPPPPETMAEHVLDRLAFWRDNFRRDGFAPVRTAWLARARNLGSEVTLRQGANDIVGRFAGLGDDGSLLLDADGKISAFAAGEVRLQLVE